MTFLSELAQDLAEPVRVVGSYPAAPGMGDLDLGSCLVPN